MDANNTNNDKHANKAHTQPPTSPDLGSGSLSGQPGKPGRPRNPHIQQKREFQKKVGEALTALMTPAEKETIKTNLYRAIQDYLLPTPPLPKKKFAQRGLIIVRYIQELLGEEHMMLKWAAAIIQSIEDTTEHNKDTIDRRDAVDMLQEQYMTQIQELCNHLVDNAEKYHPHIERLLREKHREIFFEQPQRLSNRSKTGETQEDTNQEKEKLSPQFIVHQLSTGIRYIAGQIFHRHVNLANNEEDKYYLPYHMTNILQTRKKELLHTEKKDYTKKEIMTVMEVVLEMIGEKIDESAKNTQDVMEQLTTEIIVHIPQADKLQRKIQQLISQHTDVSQDKENVRQITKTIYQHIVETDNLLHEIYTTPKHKKFLTQQLMAGLLRMEVDEPELATDALQNTYGKDFEINSQLHQTLKNYNISLMDFTIEMLELEEKDVKVLLYAMLCPKKTGENKHPIQSTDKLYEIKGNSLETLEITKKGLAYISRAFNAGIDRHFKDTYNLHAHQVISPTTQKHVGLPKTNYTIQFTSTEELIEVFTGQTTNNTEAKLSAYDTKNLSDYIASMRAFLHISGRHSLNIKRIINTNQTSTYQQLFSLHNMRRKKQQEFIEQEFVKLPLKDKEGDEVDFLQGIDPEDTAWYFKDIELGKHTKGVYSGRVKTLESMVRKMRNDAKYKHAKYVGDVVANRLEIYDDGVVSSAEQICRSAAQIFKHLYQHSQYQSGFAELSIKGEDIFVYIEKLIQQNPEQQNETLASWGLYGDTKADFFRCLQEIHTKERKNKGKPTNHKTAGLQKFKIITALGNEYQIMMHGTESQGFTHHMFYDLKKIIHDKLRINNFTDRGQVKEAAQSQLAKGTSRSLHQLKKEYPDLFVDDTALNYAFKLILLEQTRQPRIQQLPLQEKHQEIAQKRLKITCETIETYYQEAQNMHKEPLINEQILQRKIEHMDQQLLQLMLFEGRKQVDYEITPPQTDKESTPPIRYGSTKTDTKILDAYMHIFDTTTPTSAG